MKYIKVSAKIALLILMLVMTSAQAITDIRQEPSLTGSVAWINSGNYLISIDNQVFKISKAVPQKTLQQIKSGQSVKYLLNNKKIIKSIWVEILPKKTK